MGQGMLRANELTGEIRGKDLLQILDTELVDGDLWRVVAGIVDQAIELSELLDGVVDDESDLIGLLTSQA